MFSKRVKKTRKVLINGRKGYPPKVQAFINKYKNEIVRHITVMRTPINAVIQSILDKFGGKAPYDKLFHLRLQCTCRSGLKFTIEKNEVITVKTGFRKDKNDEFIHIPNAFAVTIDNFLLKAETAMGKKYFIYNAASSNCQDFRLGIVNSNGVNNDKVNTFIKQNTKSIFEGHPNLRKFANSLTDLAGKVIDPIVQGGDLYFHHKTEEGRFDGKLKTVRCSQMKKDETQCKNKVTIGVSVRHIHNKTKYNVRKRKSLIEEAGLGLFAFDPKLAKDSKSIVFRKGDKIVPYEGEIIDKDELEDRYDITTAPYTVLVKKDKYIDSALVRGIGSLINHMPKKKNCKFSVSHVKGTVNIIATKNIRNNDEIYLSYGRQYKFNDAKTSTNSNKYKN